VPGRKAAGPLRCAQCKQGPALHRPIQCASVLWEAAREAATCLALAASAALLPTQNRPYSRI
jgi:hypothetical protein